MSKLRAAERALIARSQKGDTKAFSRLIHSHEDKIFRLARQVCVGLPAEADDVYQETFLTAFKKIRGFRKDSDLGTWLYRIAANLCWLRFRKKKREPLEHLSDGRQFRDLEPTPEELAGKKELTARVAQALSEVPADYRLVLILCDVDQLSNAEAARILKLSLPAVKSRLHRGRAFLRRRFESYLASPS